MVEKIEFTSQECEDYVWFAKQCLHYARMTKKSSVSAISNGDVVVICKYTPVKAILIVDSVNFYCHPKSADNLTSVKYYDTDFNEYSLITIDQGGWLKQTDGTWYPIDARLAYSLVDEDAGTFGLRASKPDPSAKYSGTKTQNYGNLYWYNSKLNFGVLSWKGPPSIQFPIDSQYSVPGLTQTIGILNTPYTTNIYKAGKVLCQAPALVVGSCYALDDKKQKYLLSFTHDYEKTQRQFKIYKSKDTGKTWSLISEFDVENTLTTPVFISANGLFIVYKNSSYKINETLTEVKVASIIDLKATGKRTIKGTGGYNSNYSYTGTKKIWLGMSSKEEFKATNIKVTANFIEGGSGSGTSTSGTTSVPVMLGNPATNVSIMASYLDGRYQFDAYPNGNYCSVTWSGVDSYSRTRAWKTPGPCNADISVSVTFNPQGVSASYTRNAETNNMTVGGPSLASVGAAYSANNAVAPVTWSISSGSISDGGVITALQDCATSFTITAVDVCGRSASTTATRTFSPMAISGPQNVTEGQYSVTGAIGTVIWGVTSGSITSSGYATFSGCGGTVTVTATDSCGRSASYSVRMPNGSWYVVQYDDGMQDFTNDSYTNSECITGGTKISERWVFHGHCDGITSTYTCFTRPSQAAPLCSDGISRPYCTFSGGGVVDKSACAYVATRYVYNWLCSGLSLLTTTTTSLSPGTRTVYTYG